MIIFYCYSSPTYRGGSITQNSDKKTCIIDISTAHRTDNNWIYGLPELSKIQREIISNSHRVANPGCHATGVITTLYPLVNQGIVPKDYPITATSISGYSGGGKKLIEWYENNHFQNINSPKPYGLNLNHKHLPEMQKVTGLNYPPVFTPMICNFYKGMCVSIPLLPRLLNKKYTVTDINEILSQYYASEHFINVLPLDIENNLENGYLDVEACNNTNRIDIFVTGNEDRILLTARFDNLGKGASGAAIQNMNLMLGLEEKTGLTI